MRSAPAIGFDYKPSRLLAVGIVVMCGLALLAIARSGVAWWAAWVLAAFALAYGAYALWRHGHPLVAAVSWHSDGSLLIHLSGRSGEVGEVSGTLRSSRVLGSWIMMDLAWPLRGRAALWLLSDNLDADVRRRLRVRLGGQGDDASVNPDSI